MALKVAIDNETFVKAGLDVLLIALKMAHSFDQELSQLSCLAI